MKTIWKVVIILISAGLALSIIGISLGASRWVFWDISGPHVADSGYEKRITELDLEQIKNIEINLDFADIEFIEADKYGFDIRYFDREVTWNLDKGNLTISSKGKRRVHFFDINLNFQNLSNDFLKIYLPADSSLGAVSVETANGDLKIGSFSADNVRIDNSFGKLDLYSIVCNKLQIGLDNGDFMGKNLSVTGDFDYEKDFGASRFETIKAQNIRISSSNGGITLNGCEALNVEINNDFGNISANNLIATKTGIEISNGNVGLEGCRVETITVKKDFGKVSAINLISADTSINASNGDIILSGEFTGRTVINNDFGDVKITTSKPKESYTFDIYTEFGSVTFDNNKVRNAINSGNSAENTLNITNSNGDIQVYFAK